MREPRRRSPESSRRRRAERRHSREQLAAAAEAAVSAAASPSAAVAERAPMSSHAQSHTHSQSQSQHRARADSSFSSGSSSSSTSSSLLNISRKSRFGIRAFFASSAVKKVKKRRSFRNKNKSSSSVDSDLAYGAGYVSRTSFERQQAAQPQYPQHPQHHPQQYSQQPLQYPQQPQYAQSPYNSQQHPQASRDDPLFGPDGRPALHRAQTDEEIIALGRKLSDLARAENNRDLERVGRTRPSRMAAAAVALSEFHRHGSHGQQSRGLGSSRPQGHHDDADSDWESASDSDSSDGDSDLAYGSVPKFSDPNLPLSDPSQDHHHHHGASVASPVVSHRPPEAIRPPNRKSSAVDPAMFGPVNSLRGFVNTPCGFRPGEYHRPAGPYAEPPHLPALHEHGPIPQPSSASVEATPMRTVYPVPTADASRFEAAAASSSGVSVPLVTAAAAAAVVAAAAVPSTPTRRDRERDRDSAVFTNRLDPVPIQAPKPRVPVSPRVLEDQRVGIEHREHHLAHQGSPRDRRSRRSAVEAVASGALPAVVGAAAGAALVGAVDERREWRGEERGHHERREYDDRRARPTPDRRSAVEAVPAGSPSSAVLPSHHRERRGERREDRPYEQGHDRREDRPHEQGHDRRGDRRDERREDRPYEQGHDRRGDRRDERRDVEDRHHARPAPDSRSIAEIAAAGIVPAAAVAAGAAILSDSHRKRDLDKQREEDERLRYEREAQHQRDAREHRDKEERRRREEQEAAREHREKEERRRREEQEAADQYERRVREEREVRYKEERRSHDDRVRAERDRVARDAEKKRDRDEKRLVETRDDDQERSREREERRRAKGKDIATVVDSREVEKTTGGLEPTVRKPTREERRIKREETRRMMEELQRQIEAEKKRLAELDGNYQPRVAEPAEAGPSSSKKDAPTDYSQAPQVSPPERSITPLIYTVESVPDWVRAAAQPAEEREERLSRKCSFEREVRDARSIVEETNHSTIPADPVVIAAAISAVDRDRSRSRSREPRRGRDREPVRDPIQEEANRVYREKKIADRIAEDEVRSRSASPSPSVVDKYDEDDEPVVRIVTPPEMKRAPKKSKYDSPNADVRVDNYILPHEIVKFQPPPPTVSGLGPAMIPVFKSRDPSCERERPLLNIVRPTPTTSPSLEKMKAKQAAAAAAADEDSSEVEKKKGAERKPKVIIDAQGRAVEVPEDYATGRAAETDSGESSQEPPALKFKFKKKSAWGMMAALAGAAVKAKEQKRLEGEKAVEGEGSGVAEAEVEPTAPQEVLPSIETAPEPPRDASREVVPEPQAEPAPVASRAPSTPPRWSRVPFDFDEEPPQVGPKPPSPRAAQMPGAFGDDIDFPATLAAGLQSSGFDPNIVIEDPMYRRRDSPPGSNDPVYVPPSCETVVDEPSERAVIPESRDVPDWETGSTPGKKSRRKRQSIDSVKPVPEYEGKGKSIAPSTSWVDAAESIPATEDDGAVFNREPSALEQDDERSPTKNSKKTKRDSGSVDTATYSGPSSEVSVASSSSKKSKKSRRKSTKDAYDIPEQDEPPDRPGESFQWISREVSSVVSDPISRPNGSGTEQHDTKSVVSLPTNGHHDRSITQNGHGKDSFLGNAGTFGAGAGLAGAAAAIAVQLSPPNAAQDSVEEDEEPYRRRRSVSYSSQTVDPEIVEREIKPAIDPQYGDLLPLPPSEPGSPNLDDLEEEPSSLPSLPDSEAEEPPQIITRPRRSTIVHGHTRHRSGIDTTPKTPSRTAVPVQFLIGRGSGPSSPAFRFSPIHSPIASGPETSPHRNRASRPMSWDSTREFKPLYLPEKVSSAPVVEEQEYPELPPSEPPSRESPAPGAEERDDDVDYLSIAGGVAAAMGLLQALQIDPTSPSLASSSGEVTFGDMLESGFGSGETTPRARVEPARGASPSPAERNVGSLYGWDLGEPLEASPLLSSSVVLHPAHAELEDLPTLSESLPEPSPVLRSLPVPAETDLEDLPALPETRPSSPLLAAPAWSADYELEQLPALPESQPASPVLALAPPAFASLPLSEEIEHLPSLPESGPGSPVQQTIAPVADFDAPRATSETLDEPSTELPAYAQLSVSSPDWDLENLPALPESQPGSPVLSKAFQPPTRSLIDDELELLPSLPESRPLSPYEEVLASAENLGSSPTFVSPAEDTEQIPVVQMRSLEQDLEALPSLPESRPASPLPEELAPVVDLETLPTPTVAAEHDEQIPAAVLERERGLELGELPPLPETRPTSPLLEEVAPTVEVGILPSPACEQLPAVQEHVFEQDLEVLPALPDSRPASPSLEELALAVSAENLPSPAIEEIPVVQERGLEQDLDVLPLLPESRPSSPPLEPLAPADPLKSLPDAVLSSEGRGLESEQRLEGDLEALPPLPESRPGSPVEPEMDPAVAVDLESVIEPAVEPVMEPVVEEVIPAQVRGLNENLDELPPLPESRPQSPIQTEIASVEVALVEADGDLEKASPFPDSDSRPLTELSTMHAVPAEPFTLLAPHLETTPVVPSLSQESTVQERDFASQPSKVSRLKQLFEAPSTYEELKGAGMDKRKASISPTRVSKKQEALDAADKTESVLLASAAAAGAAAAGGLVIAHMRHDAARPDMQHVDYDKLDTPSYDRAESVYSFNEDASTIAASEAPTYLSGSTFYETQPDSETLEESPPRPGTLGYLLGKRGQRSQIQDDDRVIGDVSSPSKRGKKKALPEPEFEAEVLLEQTAVESTAPADETQDVMPASLDQTASARKKGKKKAGKKEVSWIEPEPAESQPIQVGEPSSEPVSTVERDIPAGDLLEPPTPEQPDAPETLSTSGSKKGKKKKKAKKVEGSLEPDSISSSGNVAASGSADAVSDPAVEPHSTSTVEEVGRQIVEEPSESQQVEPRELFASKTGLLAGGEPKQTTPAESAAEQDPGSRPAVPASAKPDAQEQVTRSRQEAGVARAEPIKAKKSRWGTSFSSLTSGGFGSLFGMGKRDSVQNEPQEVEQKGVRESESSPEAVPAQSERPKRQPSSILELLGPNPLMKPPSLGESSRRIPSVGPATGVHEPPVSDKSVGDTASSALDTAVWVPNKRDPAPGIPTPDAPVDEATPSETARVEAAVDSQPQPRDGQEGKQLEEDVSRSPVQSQAVATSDDTQQTLVDTPVAADAGDEPTDAMAKKGKKQQRKETPKDTPKDEPTPQESAQDTTPPPAPPIIADEAGPQDAVPEPPAILEPVAASEPIVVTDQAAADDGLAEPAGKKGKKAKGKKKKQAAAEADEASSVEPAVLETAPEPVVLEAQETTPEPVVLEAQETTTEPVVLEAQEQQAADVVVQSAPETLLEPAVSEVQERSAAIAPAEETPVETTEELLTAEPTISSKKSKKKKKKQGTQEAPVEVATEQTAPVAEEPKPESTLEQLLPTDSPQPESTPVITDLRQVSPEAVEAATVDLVAVEPDAVEPVAVELAAVESAGMEPVAVEPAAVDSVTVAVEPAAVEPAVVEPTAVEPAQDEVMPEPSSSGKKSKKKKKAKATATLPVEDVPRPTEPAQEPEETLSLPVEEPSASQGVVSAQAEETPALLKEEASASQGDTSIQTEETPTLPVEDPSSPRGDTSPQTEETPALPVEEPFASQGDTSAQTEEPPEPTTTAKKSKKSKKKKKGSVSLDSEPAAQLSTSEDITSTPVVDEPEPATTAPPSEQQPEMTGAAALTIEPQIDLSTGPEEVDEPARSVTFTADDQSSSPSGDTTQQDSPPPAEEMDDQRTPAQRKKDKKKKRQSVSFAEPLEEQLGSAKTRGEDDNQKTQDSKDSVSEVPPVPPQSGDSVDEQPAQFEAQSPSVQVGVTVPLPDARDVPGAGFDLESQQEPTEPPASLPLDQPQAIESETSAGLIVGQNLPLVDEPQNQTESQREVADEGKSSPNSGNEKGC